jgi:hypothetical protein
MKRLRELLKELGGTVEAALSFVSAVTAMLAPVFAVSAGVRPLAIFAGAVGVFAGLLWGLYLRSRNRQGLWLWPALTAAIALITAVLIQAVASGALTDRNGVFRWLYELFFEVLLLADVLFAIAYGLMWGAIASFVRYVPQPRVTTGSGARSTVTAGSTSPRKSGRSSRRGRASRQDRH